MGAGEELLETAMSANKNPLVFFMREQQGRTPSVSYGYLVMDNDVRWLAARREDANRDPSITKMHKLDQTLLEEQQDDALNVHFYLYRGRLYDPQ